MSLFWQYVCTKALAATLRSDCACVYNIASNSSIHCHLEVHKTSLFAFHNTVAQQIQPKDIIITSTVFLMVVLTQSSVSRLMVLLRYGFCE